MVKVNSRSYSVLRVSYSPLWYPAVCHQTERLLLSVSNQEQTLQWPPFRSDKLCTRSRNPPRCVHLWHHAMQTRAQNALWTAFSSEGSRRCSDCQSRSPHSKCTLHKLTQESVMRRMSPIPSLWSPRTRLSNDFQEASCQRFLCGDTFNSAWTPLLSTECTLWLI